MPLLFLVDAFPRVFGAHIALAGAAFRALDVVPQWVSALEAFLDFGTCALLRQMLECASPEGRMARLPANRCYRL